MLTLRSIRQSSALLILMLALVISVTALTSVAFFVDRVDRALVLQGSALMAADLVIEQGDAVPEAWIDHATRLGLKSAFQILFPSVIFHQDKPLLVKVKAVDESYPLRGELQVASAQKTRNTPPTRGEAYASPALFKTLNTQPARSLVPLGKLSLSLRGEVKHEPDVAGNLFQFAPQLMIHYQDALNSGLLTPASRAQYRFLMAGDKDSVARMQRWIKARLPTGSRIISMENSRPEMRRALDRGRRFLELAALCASLLSGIAIMLAARQYVAQAMDSVAIMRTLGMSSLQALARHLRELFTVFILGSLLGIAFGYVGQQVLYYLVGDWFGEQLPLPGLRSVGLGFAYAFILLGGFSLPALWRIRSISPLRVLRHDLEPPDISAWLSWGLAISVFAGLVVWQVQDVSLAIAMLSLIAAIFVLSVGCGWLLIVALKPFRGAAGGVGMGIAALTRNPVLTHWQLLGFTMGITMLLLLALVRVDLLETWQASLPKQAPNHFLINIQPGEQIELQTWLFRQGVKGSGMFATARGRLTHIDGRAVAPDQYEDEHAKRLLIREFSLGFSDLLQSDNQIVAGEKWSSPPLQNQGFSVEVKLAEMLRIKPGSELTFDVAGQTLSAKVDNLRQVAWDSFNVNFFVQGNASLMKELPVAYISSLYLDDNNTALVVRKLAQDYPAVSLLDIRPVLQRVRQIMDKGAMAVESVFLFTLLAAMLVTLSAVQISRRERASAIAIYRTLGASRRLVLTAMLTEFGLLGMTSGFLGAALASITGQLIASRLFGLETGINISIWLTGMGAGTLGLLVIGYLVMRSLLKTPPIQLLR